jgi:general stress protein 26
MFFSTWRSTVSQRLRATAALLIVVTAVVAEAEAPAEQNETLLRAAREVIEASSYAALVTIGVDGTPNVRMMDAFDPDEDMVIWMGTNTLSRKVEEIRRNPNVALYFADPKAPGYVTIRGTARLVDDAAETRKRWKEGWSAFYREDRSNYILIEVRARRIEVVNYPAGIVSEVDTWAAPAVDLDTSPREE